MIYFATTAENGTIKIGFTTNLAQRMVDLANYYKFSPVVLLTVDGDRSVEKQYHKRFKDYRIGSTEQFRPGPELTDFLDIPPVEAWEDVGRTTQAIFLHCRLRAVDMEMIDWLVIALDTIDRTTLIRMLVKEAYQEQAGLQENTGRPLDSASTAC